MSVFRLAKNREELLAQIKKFIAYTEQGCELYSRFKLEVTDADYEAGWAEYVHTCTEFEKNRYGNVHGGAITALLDTAIGLTAYELGTGNASPTMDIKVDFLKSVHIGDTVLIRAQVLSSGKHSAVLRADMTRDGELLATAISTNRLYTTTVPAAPMFAEKK